MTQNETQQGDMARRRASARKMKAAGIYASGTVGDVSTALVRAGYSATTAHNPSANGLGARDLIQLDLEINPPATSPRQMQRNGLEVLHDLARDKDTPDNVRAAAASALVQRVTELGLDDDVAGDGLSEKDRMEAVWGALALCRRAVLIAGRLGPARTVALIEERMRAFPQPQGVQYEERHKGAPWYGRSKSLAMELGGFLDPANPPQQAAAFRRYRTAGAP